MADLRINFAGIRSPNPFWLASAPPTNSEYQVRRAFDAGWGGVVWKTLGHEPIVNVSSRYGGIDYDGRKLLGLNNIELISDRTLEDNLQEIARVKAAYDDAVAAVDAKRTAEPTVVLPVTPAEAAPVTPPRPGDRPDVAPGRPITEYSHAELVALVRWIESDTLLRTNVGS